MPRFAGDLADLPPASVRRFRNSPGIRYGDYANSGIGTLALTTLHVFAVFHLNLAFSSIEEEQRAQVVRDCYGPLLDLAERHPHRHRSHRLYPAGDPELRSRLAGAIWRALIREGKAELIGSGYAQVIGPLVPADVVAANLRLGNQAYRDLLGVSPNRAGQ